MSFASLLGGDSSPGVRRPVARVTIGGGGGGLGAVGAVAAALSGEGGDPWIDNLVAITMISGLAPAVDALEMTVSAAGAPGVAPGDEGDVALGYEDEDPVTVFTGTVDTVRRGLGGTTRIALVNGGAALARLRVRQSFERQTPGAILRELADAAGASVGSVENGVELAFFALDDRRAGWAAIADLALRNGFVARVSPEGEIRFGPGGGTALQTFRYGDDVLAFNLTEREAPIGAATVHGEGAAGAEGQDAWGWLIKDPSAVTSTAGSGAPERFLSDAGMRSADAAEKAATGILSAAAALRMTGRLLVPGAPAVVVGGTIEVADMPDAAMNGSFLVTGIRHDYDKRRGFRTRLELVAADGGGALGALGGLL